MHAKLLSNGREDKSISNEQRIKKLNDTQLSEEYTKLSKANAKQQKELDLIRK